MALLRELSVDSGLAAGAGPDVAAGRTLDIDAPITIAHSEKENATKTW